MNQGVQLDCLRRLNSRNIPNHFIFCSVEVFIFAFNKVLFSKLITKSQKGTSWKTGASLIKWQKNDTLLDKLNAIEIFLWGGISSRRHGTGHKWTFQVSWLLRKPLEKFHLELTWILPSCLNLTWWSRTWNKNFGNAAQLMQDREEISYWIELSGIMMFFVLFS